MPVKQWDDVSLIKNYILRPHGSNSIGLDQDENDVPDTICGLDQTHERGILRWLKFSNQELPPLIFGIPASKSAPSGRYVHSEIMLNRSSLLNGTFFDQDYQSNRP